MNNKVLEKFKAGSASIGTFTHLKSISAVEALGAAGLDFVVVDMEHSPTSIDEASRLFTAADSVGMTPLVRINSISRHSVLSVLDAGARGIVVPAVETVDEVRELVEYAKFTPLGNRGFCPTRDGLWGEAPCHAGGMRDYMDYANRETLLIPQCETIGCYEHIEEIASMPGVDGIMVGPYDLSIAMGCPGEFDNPMIVSAIDKVLRVTHDNAKIAMVYAGDAAGFRQRSAQGFDSVIVNLDISVLIQAFKTLVRDAGA